MKRSNILGETGASVTQAGVQEFGSNAAVESHAGGNIVDVGIDSLSQVCHCVDERDFQSQKGVGSVLDNLRALRRGDQERSRARSAARSRQSFGLRIVASIRKRRVDTPQNFSGAF